MDPKFFSMLELVSFDHFYRSFHAVLNPQIEKPFTIFRACDFPHPKNPIAELESHQFIPCLHSDFRLRSAFFLMVKLDPVSFSFTTIATASAGQSPTDSTQPIACLLSPNFTISVHF